MTIVNQLIRRAKAEPPPSELTISDNQVDGIAEHCRELMFKPPADSSNIAAAMRRGEMKFMGIPVRVLGVRT